MLVISLLIATQLASLIAAGQQGNHSLVQDTLSSSSCRYLHKYGYLDHYPKLQMLCLFTVTNCKDVLPKTICLNHKARNDCDQDWNIGLKLCKDTCDHCVPKHCKHSRALGVQSGDIPDASFSTSSIYSISYYPKFARLHGKIGWAPDKNRIGEWIQIDLGQPTIVDGIATQGSGLLHEWVKSYKLKYSLDGVHFYSYHKVLGGNSNRNDIVRHAIQPLIKGRYIRVYPQTYYNYMTMRLELYGCVY